MTPADLHRLADFVDSMIAKAVAPYRQRVEELEAQLAESRAMAATATASSTTRLLPIAQQPSQQQRRRHSSGSSTTPLLDRRQSRANAVNKSPLSPRAPRSNVAIAATATSPAAARPRPPYARPSSSSSLALLTSSLKRRSTGGPSSSLLPKLSPSFPSGPVMIDLRGEDGGDGGDGGDMNQDHDAHDNDLADQSVIIINDGGDTLNDEDADLTVGELLERQRSQSSPAVDWITVKPAVASIASPPPPLATQKPTVSTTSAATISTNDEDHQLPASSQVPLLGQLAAQAARDEPPKPRVMYDHQPRVSSASSVTSSSKQPLQTLDAVRRQADRKKLHAFDCPCCADYYRLTMRRGDDDEQENAQPTNPAERARLEQVRREMERRLQHRRQESSRHRRAGVRAKTPEGFWDLGFDEKVRVAEPKRFHEI